MQSLDMNYCEQLGYRFSNGWTMVEYLRFLAISVCEYDVYCDLEFEFWEKLIYLNILTKMKDYDSSQSRYIG